MKKERERNGKRGGNKRRQKMDEDIEGEYRCKSMGMEWVSGHHRYRNGRRIAYVAGHCRKIASGHGRVR